MCLCQHNDPNNWRNQFNSRFISCKAFCWALSEWVFQEFPVNAEKIQGQALQMAVSSAWGILSLESIDVWRIKLVPGD
jgi:hypothetical protein